MAWLERLGGRRGGVAGGGSIGPEKSMVYVARSTKLAGRMKTFKHAKYMRCGIWELGVGAFGDEEGLSLGLQCLLGFGPAL